MKKVVILLTLILAVLLFCWDWERENRSGQHPLASTWSTPKVISTGVANAKRPVLKLIPSNPGKLMVSSFSMQSNVTTAIDPLLYGVSRLESTWSTPALVCKAQV
ncbi:MAG: hypothetical protein IPH82_16160 [Chloroflexi bacterium]|nr:hypothetical protein [Chloroflexota bacterium]